MKYTLFILVALGATFFSCKKEKKTSNPHQFAGVWKIKSAGSGQYLKYYESGSNTGFDIYSGVETKFIFSAGNHAGQYYIAADQNKDRYMDLNNLNYTYLTSNGFANSNTQLFTVEPIFNNADRYYIRSVADTSQYLISNYKNYGTASTTLISNLNFTYWDCIWALEK